MSNGCICRGDNNKYFPPLGINVYKLTHFNLSFTIQKGETSFRDFCGLRKQEIFPFLKNLPPKPLVWTAVFQLACGHHRHLVHHLSTIQAHSWHRQRIFPQCSQTNPSVFSSPRPCILYSPMKNVSGAPSPLRRDTVSGSKRNHNPTASTKEPIN